MFKRMEKLLLELAVFAVIGLGLLITTSVLLRVFFNSGVPDAIVMVKELMVAAIVLPLAAATSARAHIVVEFLANRLSVRAQSCLVIFGSLVGLFALSPLIYAGWNEMMHAFSSGGFFFGELNLPKWPGRLIFLLGISMCWLRLLLMVIGDVKRVLAGLPVLENEPIEASSALIDSARVRS